MDRISRHSQAVEGVWFGDLTIGSLLFQMMWSCWLYQSVTSTGSQSIEVTRMKITTSKSEAMVHGRKKVNCLLRVGEEILPQVEEFKYLVVMFTSEG